MVKILRLKRAVGCYGGAPPPARRRLALAANTPNLKHPPDAPQWGRRSQIDAGWDEAWVIPRQGVVTRRRGAPPARSPTSRSGSP